MPLLDYFLVVLRVVELEFVHMEGEFLAFLFYLVDFRNSFMRSCFSFFTIGGLRLGHAYGEDIRLDTAQLLMEGHTFFDKNCSLLEEQLLLLLRFL